MRLDNLRELYDSIRSGAELSRTDFRNWLSKHDTRVDGTCGGREAVSCRKAGQDGSLGDDETDFGPFNIEGYVIHKEVGGRESKHTVREDSLDQIVNRVWAHVDSSKNNNLDFGEFSSIAKYASRPKEPREPRDRP